MMLRINNIDVPIIEHKLIDPPGLVEELTDHFEFRADLESKVDLLIDDKRLTCVRRHYTEPEIIHWDWEKGLAGRVGFVKCSLYVDDALEATGILKINPRKFTLEEYTSLLDEINYIAYNIVYDLRGSVFEHLDLIEPDKLPLPKSGIEWLETIGAVINELEDVLHSINKQPHMCLDMLEQNRFIWEIGRPSFNLVNIVTQISEQDSELDHGGLAPALSQPLRGWLPIRLTEEIYEQNTNTYENQLIAQFLEIMEQRIRTIKHQTTKKEENELASLILQKLETLCSLPFLNDITPLRQPPHPTLVLLNNFRYRQFYEIFRQYHWGLRIHYRDLDACDLFRLTTQHVYEIYEAWAFFKVIEATKLVTNGRTTLADKIINILHFDELLVNLREGSRVIFKTQDNQSVVVTYQPYFKSLESQSLHGAYSVSLPKRPDITMQILGKDTAIVFDSKYRLDSESSEELGQGTPKAEDINKMHVYRDAIRFGPERSQFINSAYILYPGNTPKFYDSDRLGAIPLRPGFPLDSLVDIIKLNLQCVQTNKYSKEK